MIVIPIGIDCGLATLLKEYNVRTTAYPFDWIVTYQGIHKFIENDFQNFFPSEDKWNHLYKFNFVEHDEFPRDFEKYNRRLSRFKTLLEKSTEPIIFIRKGHFQYHHTECNDVSNDLHNAELLCEI
jgi:hypothetical protein